MTNRTRILLERKIRQIVQQELSESNRRRRRKISEESKFPSVPTSGRYVKMSMAGDNLVLSFTSAGKKMAKEEYNNDAMEIERNFYEFFEDINANSEFSYSDDLGQDGFGLTSAPGIIAGNLSDTGGYKYEDDAEVWYYPDYQIKPFVSDMMKNGKAIFRYAE